METYLEKNKKLKPSPNMKVLVSNSAQDIFLELRVTHVNIDKEILGNFLDTVSDSYMISEEISKKKVLHYHTIITEIKSEYNDIEKFREVFKNKFPFLNSGHMYNLALVKNTDKYIAYIIKEHENENSEKLIIKGNWNQEMIKGLFNYKYAKFDKRRIVEEMEAVEIEYCKLYKNIHPMSEAELLQKLCEIKLKYNQVINWNYMCQYVEKIKCKIDKNFLEARCMNKWANFTQDICAFKSEK